MAALGLSPDDYESDKVVLWPDNERAVQLLVDLSTQWRMGFAGPVGLDYSPFFHRMDRMRLSDDEYENLFMDLRIAESEALKTMNKRSD